MAKQKLWPRFVGFFYLSIVLVIPFVYNSCEQAQESAEASSLSCKYYQAAYVPGGEALVKSSTRARKVVNKMNVAAKASLNTVLAVRINKVCATKSQMISNRILNANNSPSLSSLDQQTYEYRLQSQQDIESLSLDPCVLMVNPTKTYKLSTSFSEPMSSLQQNYFFPINSIDSYSIFYNSTYGIQALNLAKPLVVAVIDSGVDHTHSDLQGQIINLSQNGSNNYGYNVTTESFADISDIEGHGTHIAGTIAAKVNSQGIHGISPVNTAIMNLKTFYPTSSGPKTNSILLRKAIDLAVKNKVDIINLSLQDDSDNPDDEDLELKQAIQDAVDAGVFVVISLGNAENFPQNALVANQATVIPGKYGHSIKGAITVIATDGVNKNLAPFSYYHPEWGEIAAPGADIYSTSARSITGKDYEYRSGTSQAAPIVSSAAALLINFLRGNGYQPNPELIEEMLKSSSLKLKQLNSYVENGNHLDLLGLTQLAIKRFPSTVGITCEE